MARRRSTTASTNDRSSLHHVTITVPPVPEITRRPSNYMNLGMYVQTDTVTDRIN